MDSFDEIIKQKVEQFNVPYNEAHWAEMNGKLNTIRATQIKKTVLSVASAIAVLAISSYFIFFNNETTIKKIQNTIVQENPSQIVIKKNIDSKEKNTSKTNATKIVDNNVIINKNVTEENKTEISSEDNNNENSISNNNANNKEENNNVAPVLSTNNKVPNAEFIVYNNKVCLGEIVSFEALENEQSVSYTWDFGDGTISHKANPQHIYKDSRSYTISLSLTNRQSGIEKTSTQKNVVTILPLPKANFAYSEISIVHDDNKLKYPYTIFTPKVTNQLATYKWTFGNGETSNSINARTIYTHGEKNYTATLFVTNVNGCSNSYKVDVFNKNGINLFAPTGFKPITANSSKAETFIPQALLGWDVQFEMIIIDKSNKIVYKTSDKNEPWNGRLNNKSQLLDEGIYMWQVITYDAEGTPYRHNGQIHLLK